MAEITVAGHKVVLRDKFPVGEQFGVIGGWSRMYPVGQLSYQEQITPMMPVVESWDFPGDPHDIAAWADLDGFAEFLPLWRAISLHLSNLYDAQQAHAKNSDAPPISPGA